jgi:ABC-type nitrate/sulfonate/bicarbonate transport system ATPase subunit
MQIRERICLARNTVSAPHPSRLCLHRVSKTFAANHGPVEALREIDLDILEEEFLCIVEPTGDGNS